MDVNVYRGTVDELKANWPFKREWSSGTDVLTHPGQPAIETTRPWARRHRPVE